MHTTLNFLVVLNARRLIVGASPELLRTTDKADTANVVSEWLIAIAIVTALRPMDFTLGIYYYQPEVWKCHASANNLLFPFIYILSKEFLKG